MPIFTAIEAILNELDTLLHTIFHFGVFIFKITRPTNLNSYPNIEVLFLNTLSCKGLFGFADIDLGTVI
jgi:hypothetical protein